MTLSITVPEEIAKEIVGLSEAERETFVVDILSEAWREAARWDAQMEADILAGKWDKMAVEAHESYLAGQTLPPPSAKNRYQIATGKPRASVAVA